MAKYIMTPPARITFPNLFKKTKTIKRASIFAATRRFLLRTTALTPTPLNERIGPQPDRKYGGKTAVKIVDGIRYMVDLTTGDSWVLNNIDHGPYA